MTGRLSNRIIGVVGLIIGVVAFSCLAVFGIAIAVLALWRLS